jgi:hypothetical protein
MQIGRPAHWQLPPEVLSRPCFEYDLREGDELKIGETIFAVDGLESDDRERERADECPLRAGARSILGRCISPACSGHCR